MSLGFSLKGKESQFIDAVETVICKKFLNEPTDEWENFCGFKLRMVEKTALPVLVTETWYG